MCALVIEKVCGKTKSRYACFIPLREGADYIDLHPHRVLWERENFVGRAPDGNYLILAPHHPTVEERAHGLGLQMLRDAWVIARGLADERTLG